MGAPKLGCEKLVPRKPHKLAARGEWLERLYIEERFTSIELGRLFDVSHKSVLRALDRFGIVRRKVGESRHVTCCEDGCQLPIYKVRHATNGSWYGRRCRLHWIVFRMMVNQRYNDKHLGKDDEAWLRRMRQLLARAQRLNREVLRSLKPVSKPETISPDACLR